MVWRFPRAAAVVGLLPALAAANSGIIQVTSVRSWSHPDSTRVIIETTGPFEYRSDRAHNPDRLFLDILHARPWIEKRRLATHEVGDHLLSRVRVAETTPGTTRIVFDLAGPADFKVTKLDAPDRVVVELRPIRAATHEAKTPTETAGAEPIFTVHTHLPPAYSPPPYSAPGHFETSHSVSSETGRLALPGPLPSTSQTTYGGRPFVYPPTSRRVQVALVENPPLFPGLAFFPSVYLPDSLSLVVKPPSRVRGASAVALPPPRTTFAVRPESAHQEPVHQETAQPESTRTEIAEATPLASENPSRSLTRALGLKVNRIVIDAGHGGHDDGTIGPHGVLEKDIVLDVALRLATLVRQRMSAEVVLTRSDDTFIPLQDRTKIANDNKADLFLSIHANSSPAPEVAGTETFYLNLTTSPGALDVAARENSGSDKTVGDLKDLIQSITLNDKIEESHTFAQDVQNAINLQAERANAAAHNRGVKRAPFVVLIGASMPSVLAEIGFLSNSRDEANLGKPEYRQKVAEALYKGLAQYSQSLSHFDTPKQVAAKTTEKPVPAGLN
jgi:N-acetylmuramoyl-L-alanine amidase